MVYILGFFSLVELIMFFILALKDNDGFIFMLLMYAITIVSILSLLL